MKNFYCVSSQIEKNGQFYGRFKIGPFETHTGITFANCLRRTLLADSSRESFNGIQICGIEHEYSSLVGVRESVIDIIFNLEKLVFQKILRNSKPQIGLINFHGPGILRAHHIHLPKDFQCVYPNQYIATVEVDGYLNFKLFFYNKKHFQKRASSGPRNYLFTNPNLCCIEKINYTIEPQKQKQFVLFEIWTNGSIHPQKALNQALNQILLEFFSYTFQLDSGSQKAMEKKLIWGDSSQINFLTYCKNTR